MTAIPPILSGDEKHIHGGRWTSIVRESPRAVLKKEENTYWLP
jgi:hypothetical protein